MYKKICAPTVKVEISIITQVISFLDNRKRENLKELAYDFAIGLLDFYYIDQKSGLSELRKFSKKAKRIEKYKVLTNFLEKGILLKRKKRKR